MGGAGNAGALLASVAKGEQGRKALLDAEHADLVLGLVGRSKSHVSSGSAEVKQGAYGKVPTHSTAKLDQLSRPLEVAAALRFKLFTPFPTSFESLDPDVVFCDKMLGKVSRSFAAVIRQLPKDLCIDIAIFYLVLRALDTVEDDMEAYKGRETEKQTELINFGRIRLSDAKCSMDGVGAGDERVLLQQFGAVARVFQALPKESRDVISDITDRMGAGMAEYVSADLAQGTVDQEAYDRYCFMVAGLVGEGLTRIFVARGAEREYLCGQGEHVWPFCADVADQPLNYGIASSMGLFLQKTNIIRDYLEDYVDGRAFWPQTVWKKHAKTNDLGEFARPTAHGAGIRIEMAGAAGCVVAKGCDVQALCCLNELVADALELVPDCLEYLERVKTPAIYRFCAIPQLMAIATLTQCFDNPKLFTGVVKLRKGLTVRLIQACVDGEDAVHWWFSHFAEQLSGSVAAGQCAGAQGPIGERVANACARITVLTAKGAAAERNRSWRRVAACGAVASTVAAATIVVKTGSA